MILHLCALFCALSVVQGVCPVSNTNRTSASGDGVVSINTTQYIRGIECDWTITNQQSCPNGTPIVMLEWLNISTEPVKDQIIIYDGSTHASRVLQQVSGTAIESPVNSSTPTVFIDFSTDNDTSSTEKGFALRYRFGCGPPQPTISNCQPPEKAIRINVTTSIGRLNFSDSQGSYQDCAWVISNELSSCLNPFIEIEFTNFSATFPFDYLDLYDGDTISRSTQIGHYQGPKVYYGPGFQRSVGKRILIVFHNEYSHPGDNWAGFEAAFRARCDAKPMPNCPSRDAPKIYNQSGFMVFSPAHYRPNSNCYFLFQNTNSSCQRPVVLMIFPVFRTTELYDTVALWNGNVSGNPADLIGKWSGSAYDAVPLGFQKSSGSQVLLEFHSGSMLTDDINRGFTAQWAFVCGEELPSWDTNTCPPYLGAALPAARGPGILNFTSDSYRNNLDCGWVYVNNQSSCPANSTPVVQLEFLHFETEANFDFFNIYDGPMERQGASVGYDDFFLLGSWSGSHGWEVPTVVRSTQPSVMLTFHSDGTISDVDEDDAHNDGFQVKVSNVCSRDPLPPTNYYDCRGDNDMPYARFWTPDKTLQNPRVFYGHHYLPFSLAYPTIIEQFFTNPANDSMLASRGAQGVTGELVVGIDVAHAGQNATWRCCDRLNTTKNLTGAIVMCERGDCLFVDKVRTAQRYGAAGVIVVDTSESGVRMGSTVDVSDLHIPSVSTVPSLGYVLLNATARARVFAQLVSFTCPAGTFSPTTAISDSPTPVYLDTPTNSRSLPPAGAPSPPDVFNPPTTMFFTLPFKPGSFTQDLRVRFMSSIHTFFGWVPETAFLTSFGADPDNGNLTVAQVQVDARNAEQAYSRWGSATAVDKMMLSPQVVAVSSHPPHTHCINTDCYSTSMRTAAWNPNQCTCSRSMTGAAVFVEILLPIFLICLLILLLCCCLPMCPLFGKWRRQQRGHQKVAVDELHTHNINMVPRGVVDSEESMRGEGQPYGETEDPPAARRAWDEVDQRRGSSLVRPSETDQEPIRLTQPRSDDSDDEAEGPARRVHG